MERLLILLLIATTAYADDETFEPFEVFDKPITEALVWDDTHTAGTISDYGQYFMVAAPYLYASQNEFRVTNFIRSAAVQGFTAGITHLAKITTKRTRPNGRGTKSFFSGHTSIAFTGAGLVCMQTKGVACYGSVAIASGVGYLRIAARKHWFSDVVVGAGFGYMSGKFIPGVIVGF